MKKIYSLAFIFFLLTACNTSSDSDEEVEDTTIIDDTQAAVGFEDSFPSLFNLLKKEDSSFNAKEFELTQVSAIDSFEAYKLNEKDLKNFYPFLVYNSDSTMSVDVYSYSYLFIEKKGKLKAEAGGPDTEIGLINHKNKTRRRIFYSGPAMNILEAKWLSDSTFFLAGTEVMNDKSVTPVILKFDLQQNSMEWYKHKTINADISDYVEENILKRN